MEKNSRLIIKDKAKQKARNKSRLSSILMRNFFRQDFTVFIKLYPFHFADGSLTGILSHSDPLYRRWSAQHIRALILS